MRRTSRFMISVLALLLVFAFAVSAQTKETPKAGDKKMPPQEDMQKMMADYAKFMNPGKGHEILAKMAGDWTVTGKMWMDPKGAPMDMKPGTEHCELILGGRFLQSSQKGEMMGMPYEGQGLMGYDNYRQQYQMTWVDNMGTVVSTAAGTMDSTTKTLTLMGKMDEPTMNMKDIDVKYVYLFPDDKTTTFQIWQAGPDKNFFKVMEMTYAKK
jgi:hypothetical protein